MTTNGHLVTDLSNLDPRKLAGEGELGNAFAVGDRIFRSYADWKTVYEEASWQVRDIADMLSVDGNVKKLEQVLTLPIRGADYEIAGDGPEATLARDSLAPMLNQLIEQCTAAVWSRRAFFEKVWTVNDQGRIVYARLAWRPPTSCDAAFEEKTAAPDGFKQRLAATNWWSSPAVSRDSSEPGTVRIPRHKAFVYTHGAHREPVKGVSDLDVCYAAYELKQKLKFLWGQYLENQSLPRVEVYGPDIGEAQAAAQMHADARASGIIPRVLRPDLPKAFEVIESSGKGAGQFIEAIRYLEQDQTNSVLAGFTDLTQVAHGTYSLSADQSEFFLASRQAVADEIADAITAGVIAPLVILNFGVDAEVPHLRIGPIGNRQTDRALDILKMLLVAPGINAPDAFLDGLLTHTASLIGLDPDKLAESIEEWRHPAVSSPPRQVDEVPPPQTPL